MLRRAIAASVLFVLAPAVAFAEPPSPRFVKEKPSRGSPGESVESLDLMRDPRKAGPRLGTLNQTFNPANILMYANPSSDAATTTLSPRLEIVLTKIGHTVMRVEERAHFEQIVRDGAFTRDGVSYRVEIVLGALEDVKDLKGAFQVVPVLATSNNEPAFRKKFPTVLTASARPGSHIPSIDTVARKIAGSKP